MSLGRNCSLIVVFLGSFVTAVCSQNTSLYNLTIKPERLLVEQGKEQSIKAQFEIEAPKILCSWYCDGKEVSKIEADVTPDNKKSCSHSMTPKNVTQNCTVKVGVIRENYTESVSFTVERALIVNQSAVYVQEGQDADFGDIHGHYYQPLKCIFDLQDERYQQTNCSLVIKSTVIGDAVEHRFNICLPDSADESCVSGTKSLSVFTTSLDQQSKNFTLTLYGKLDELDITCVTGCHSENFSHSENLTNRNLFIWEEAKFPIKIKIGNRNFIIDASDTESGQKTNTGIWIGITIAIAFVIILIIVVIVLIKKKKCHCSNAAANNTVEEILMKEDKRGEKEKDRVDEKGTEENEPMTPNGREEIP